MKFMAMTKFKAFSANYYDFTSTTGASGGSLRTYFSSGRVTFSGGLGMSSGLIIYTKNAPLRVFSRIDGVAGKDGKVLMTSELNPLGITYEVRTAQPMLTPYGTVEGYKHTLVSMETDV